MKFRLKLPIDRTLLIILVVAFVLRFAGAWYGLPSLYYSDEPFNVVNALAYGAKKSLEPTYFVYPALYSYFLLGVYGLYFVAGTLTGSFGNALDFGAAYFINPGGLFLTGRILSVLLGVAAIFLVFRIAQRYFSQRVAYLAAALLALSTTHTNLSHWILPEAAVAFMSALALYAVFRFHELPTFKSVLMAGVACGLAISTKYNAGFVMLSLLLSIFLHFRREPSRLVKFGGGGLLAVLAGFLIGSPYWLLSFSSYMHDLKYTVAHVDAGMVGHISSLPILWPLWEMIYSDWTVGLLLVTGFFYAFTQPEKKQYLLLAFVLPTLVVMGFWDRTGVHYLAPVLPALAILAAVFFDKIVSLKMSTSLRIVLVAVALLPSLVKIAYQDIRLTQEDTRTAAKAWIESHIRRESMIAYENYVYGPNLFDPARFLKNASESRLLPLEIKERLLEESRRRTSYRLVNLRKDFRLRALSELDVSEKSGDNAYVRQLLETRLPKLSSVRKAGVPYLMISSDNYARYFRGAPPAQGTAVWLSYQNGRRFYQSVLKSDDLILLQEFNATFWSLGPTIKIYKFKKDDEGGNRE